MFAKPVITDMEAQPAVSKRAVMAPSSMRNLIEINQNGRPIIRWRRLRPNLKEAGRSILRKSSSNLSKATSASSSTSSLDKKMASMQHLGAANPMRFLQENCPEDVLSLILAYAGPQQAAVLKRTNRHWRIIMDKETTWKVMCQELYKWKEGDEEPESWKTFYRMSPCVPVDYPTVEAALRLANAPTSSRRPQPTRQARTVRVLLRPGTYHLVEGINVHALPGVSITVESITLPPTCRWYRSTAPPAPKEEAPERALSPRARNPPRSLFQLFRCASRNNFPTLTEEPTENCSVSEEGSNSNWMIEDYPVIPIVPPKRAAIIMRSRRNNEPMVRVRQGQINLKNLDLTHSCHGTDIWNGNAAVQVQPHPTEEEEPTPLPDHIRPRAALTNCRVKSTSGRGVVNIDGGHLDVDSCFIGGCAATGLYVGGPGSSAMVQRTDVYNNGRGNTRRRGIARGHSGVYLEQGTATLDNCLVAANTLTGITAVSQDKAFLTLTQSTIAQNGTNQMELPPLGSAARSKCVIEENDIGATELRSRSGLWKSV